MSFVEVEPADSLSVEVWLDNVVSEAPVTREAVTNVLREAVRDARVPLNRDAPKGARAQVRVRVTTQSQLPVSQGFGMSAAGALSAALALAKCLRMGRSEAVRAAHAADVTMRGGLGDVVAAAQGGFEVRVAPGVPPFGALRSFVGYGDAVLCVVGGVLETRRVLSDPQARAAVNEAGGRALGELLKGPTLPAFLEQSLRFARESRLMSPALERAVDAARQHGAASMSMLGNSVFAFGDVPRLAEVLARHGETMVVPVDVGGARLVDFTPS